jgi:3-oxoacyl-[acyl-carrier-protein] synthase III
MKIQALSTALPEMIVTNEDLEEQYPQWNFTQLEKRTGVLARHVAAPGETALDLAVKACKKLEVDGKLEPGSIDAVLFCTESPDYLIPGNSGLLQSALGLETGIFCLDINMGCSAYPHLLQIAHGLHLSGVAKRILIVTSDTYSKYIHPDDRATRSLFGDGATATIAIPSDAGEWFQPVFGSNGDEYDRFWMRNGGAKYEKELSYNGIAGARQNYISMKGVELLSFFNSVIPEEVDKVLAINGLAKEDVDAFVFHQASDAVLDSLQRFIAIPEKKMIKTISHTGNLVSASIPAALNSALQESKILNGQLVLLCGFGVGLSWGSVLIRV